MSRREGKISYFLRFRSCQFKLVVDNMPSVLPGSVNQPLIVAKETLISRSLVWFLFVVSFLVCIFATQCRTGLNNTKLLYFSGKWRIILDSVLFRNSCPMAYWKTVSQTHLPYYIHTHT